LVCPGSTNTYSIPAPAGALSYNWTLPSGWTGYSTTNTITVKAGNNSGNISVSVHNACGVSAPQVLNVAVASIDLSVDVSGATITANQSGATYKWVNCNAGYSAIAGQTGQSYTAAASGNYAVVVTYNGCSDTSVCTNIEITGLPESPNAALISVFPNPGSGDYVVKSGKPFINAEAKVVDIHGQVVYENKSINGENIRISIADEVNGIYFLEIKNENYIVRKKICKMD